MKTNNHHRVIVLGTNHYNTLGLIWSLGEAGHEVILLLYDTKNIFVNKSKYITKTIIIREGDNVVELIKHIASEMDEKPIVFVSNDADATLLNAHYKELSDYCFFEGGRPDGSINQYRDKDTGENLAFKCGFTIPKTATINNPDEINSISLKYPIVVKANNSIHGGKSAMHKCANKQEAEQFLQGLPNDYYPLQVQQFIEKEYEIMLLGSSLYGGKKLMCRVANKKIRHYPNPMGLGSYSESVDVKQYDDLQYLASKIALYMREIEYTGNFSAEFLYSKGEYYFLEINLRNDGTSWLSTCSGFNLPDMVCHSFVDDNVTDEGCNFRKMFFMNIMADFNYVKQREISFWKWLKQFNNDTCYSHYNKNDKRPFFAYAGAYLFSPIKRLFKRWN